MLHGVSKDISICYARLSFHVFHFVAPIVSQTVHHRIVGWLINIEGKHLQGSDSEQIETSAWKY